MIVFKDVQKQRNSLDLKNINLEMDSGYIHLINGKNSHGKSTLLKLIAGIIQPDSGDIRVNGLSVDEFKSQYVISYMPDVFPLVNKGSIENLMEHMNGFKKFSTVDFKYYMNKFNLTLNKEIKELSLGEKKIVEFCLAVSKVADVYLMDEPSLHLDREHLDTMQSILQEIMTDETKHMIIATNNVADFIDFSDYIVYVINGSVVLNVDRECLSNTTQLIDKSTYETKSKDLKILWMNERIGKYLVISDEENLGKKINSVVGILKTVGDLNG